MKRALGLKKYFRLDWRLQSIAYFYRNPGSPTYNHYDQVSCPFQLFGVVIQTSRTTSQNRCHCQSLINLLQTTHERLDIFVLNRKIDNIHAIYYFSEDIHTIDTYVIFIRFFFHSTTLKEFMFLKTIIIFLTYFMYDND